jgi:hypothetical protein
MTSPTSSSRFDPQLEGQVQGFKKAFEHRPVEDGLRRVHEFNRPAVFGRHSGPETARSLVGPEEVSEPRAQTRLLGDRPRPTGLLLLQGIPLVDGVALASAEAEDRHVIDVEVILTQFDDTLAAQTPQQKAAR